MDTPSYPWLASAPTYSQTQPGQPPDIAQTTSPDADSTSSEDIISSTPARDHGAPPSLPKSPAAKGTGILKGTGPELDGPSHRPRPAITYNLKELSLKARAPAAPAESDPREAQQSAQYDGAEHHHPAKRQRLEDNGASSLNASPETVDQNASLEPNSESLPKSSGTHPSHFNTALLQYIGPILLDGGVVDPVELLSLEFFRPFISLPRVRDIEWNSFSKRGKWTYRTKVDVIALLVQLTGNLAPSCCLRCNPPIGMFVGCIVTSSQAHAKQYYGCANCLYHGTQTYCSLKTWGQQRFNKAHSRCSPCAQVHAVCTQERPVCQQCRSNGRQCSYPEDATGSIGAQNPSHPFKNGTGAVGRPPRPGSASIDDQPAWNITSSSSFPKPLNWTSMSTAPQGQSTRTAPTQMMTTEPTQLEKSISTDLSGTPAAPPTPSDQPQPDMDQKVPFAGAAAWTTEGAAPDEASRLREIPSMEKWERAPGRVRSQAPGKTESKHGLSSIESMKLTSNPDIAFSKAYLANGAEVQVCREASFKVEIVPSGHAYTFKAEDGVTRICSIASAGKLNVKMDGEPPIVIGPHGMFTVRPRSACLVESEVYDEVALHITSVKTD
ncbi:unnamed protein product [Discula destructiva]